MAASLEHAQPPAEGTLPATRHGYRAGIVAAVAAVGLAFALAPLAIVSVISVLHGPVVGRTWVVMRPTNLQGEWTKLNLSAFKIDETARKLTVRVTGFHNCPAASCPARERIQLFSVHAEPTGALGAPPSQTIDLPKDSGEIEQEVTLPIDGNLTDYPFDHYTLLLGVAFSRAAPGGKYVPSTVRAAGRALAYTVEDGVPRLTMAQPRILQASDYDRSGVVYDNVVALRFSRPLYLRVLTIDLILLIVISAIYGVIFRPFNQIIPTVGGLVLGIWGVRSLLVGSYPPDSTGVDLVLETAILLVLLVVGVRSIHYMWPNAHLRPAAPRPELAADEDTIDDGLVEVETEPGGDEDSGRSE